MNLADSYFTQPAGKRSRNYYGDYEDSGLNGLVLALPPPAAWDMIVAGLEKRLEAKHAPRPALLRIMMSRLSGDSDAVKPLFEKLAEDDTIRNDSGTKRYLKRLKSRVFKTDGKDDDDDEEKSPYDKMRAAVFGSDWYWRTLPDIAKELSEEETVKLLREIFTKSAVFDGGVAGKQTLEIAQRVVQEMRDEITVPFWWLVNSTPEGEALFKMFVERFPKYGREVVDTTNYKQHVNRYGLHDALENLIAYKISEGLADEAVGIIAPYISFVREEKNSDYDYDEDV
ncbi:MAG: hypothetical protein FWG05_03090, partial [Kiritimatiellaeota bacterium]|nr:hypothetical protein [Kiritimatiellota bacterium]